MGIEIIDITKAMELRNKHIVFYKIYIPSDVIKVHGGPLGKSPNWMEVSMGKSSN